jgi:hypothetical protein
VVDSNKDINLGTGGLTSATLSTTGAATVGGTLTVTGNLYGQRHHDHDQLDHGLGRR